ncbi:histone deacetylase family protein [Lichenibacterium dinghuense]|uniref:histone deacetylase family protein n=1 Tax=Lichenibacterium dinghuense TaxID=2895977 RepID=UPI001F40B6AF|nr:histone deacetylase family protein [Lichenibacterium sp. 6Y81]
MRAFHHPDQVLHAPQQYMRFGRLAPVRDLPARTERLLGALARRGVAVEPPPALGTGPALAVHTPAYLRFLETAWARWEALPDRGPEVWPNTFPYWSGRPGEAARPDCPATGLIGQAGWYLGDLSVPMGPDTWTSALRSNETAAAAADALVAGERSAYALCRPSGHHARADRASGFCYLNNTAVAARRLGTRFARVAIVDVDAHHGDGTQQIFYTSADVLTVSIHADPSDYYPFYTGYAAEAGHGAGEGFNLNLPLPHGSGGDAMAAALDAAAERVRGFGAEALVVALGFDAHRDDPIGVLKLDAADFHAVGRRLAALGLPTLVVQEGGYALDAIGPCLDAFLEGFSA